MIRARRNQFGSRARRVAWRAGALTALLVLAAGVALAPPAAAHAELVSTVPADGARLDESPPDVVVVFSEEVSAELGGLQVLDAAGDRADEGAVEVDGVRVSVPLRADLPDGSYVVSYRVVSADSHPIRGAFVFAVGDQVPDEGLLAGSFDESGDRWWEVAGAVARWTAYAGTLVAAGGAVFLGVVHRGGPDRRRLVGVVTAAAAVGALGVLLTLPVQAALATGRGAGALLQEGVLSGVLADGVGWATAAGLAGLCAVVVGVHLHRWLAIAGAVLAAGSFAGTGHNRASDLPALATMADLTHLWAAAVWLGGLVLLPLALRSTRGAHVPDAAGGGDAGAATNPVLDRPGGGDDLERALELRRHRELVARFSTTAAVAVVVVALAGLVLSWVEVRSIGALTSTDYGALLLAKVGVVSLVVALAAYNNRVLVPAVGRGRAVGAVPRMRRLVLAEAALVAVVLGITAVLVTVTPARVSDADRLVERFVELGDAGSVQLVVDPARAGLNTVHLYTLDPQGRPGSIAEELTLEASLPDAAVGPLTRAPVPVGDAHLQLDDDLFAVPGTWEVTVRARTDRFTEVTGTTDVPISP